MPQDTEQLRYPIGKFEIPVVIAAELIGGWVDDIAATPQKLNALVDGLTEEQLATPYRPSGWTVQQVVHHFPDFNVNGYMRIKLALTEDTPVIKPYLEDKWAALPDSDNGDITPSLTIMNGLIPRWVKLLRALDANDLKRKIYHPEAEREFSIEELIGNYSWHNRHHIAHIQNLKTRMGW